MIKDLVFSELQYDYIWYKNCKIKFDNKEADIVLTIDGEADVNLKKNNTRLIRN